MSHSPHVAAHAIGAAAHRFSKAEWHELLQLYAVVAILHIVGFGLFLRYAAPHPAMVGLGLAAYMFGLRHAFDADHIAAVDDTVRFMLQRGKNPLGVGFFFSLGHSTIVLMVAVVLVFATSALANNLPQLRQVGVIIGAGVSGFFLLFIAVLNLRVLRGIVKAWGHAKSDSHDHAHMETLLGQRGFFNRLLGARRKGALTHAWQMYPIGVLFGLGFDTASEVGLLAMTAGASTTDLPIAAVLSLPVLFAAGMSALDTTDGVLMCKAYRWAFVNPVRKIFYNLATTGVAVAVALTIGGVELAQVALKLWPVQGSFADTVRGIDFGTLGYAIVAFFLVAWAVAVAWWKLGRFEARYPQTVRLRGHEHAHEGGLTHAHKHFHTAGADAERR